VKHAIPWLGLMLAAAVYAATPEEAARLFDAKHWQAAVSAYRAIVEREPGNAFAWFRLARAEAAAGDPEAALAALQSWVAAGGGAYAAAMTAPELESLRRDVRFQALIAPLRPCSGPEFRQFDFWLGEWNVEAPANPGRVSRSSITSTNAGCTIHEHYRSPGGYEGSSLNFFDASRKRWHQTWIDNQGQPLYLEGGLQGQSMVLATTGDAQNVQRITWTPLPDGRVRQHWESTDDGGSTWTTVFDGYYSRRGGD
jgi:hypothetical protein